MKWEQAQLKYVTRLAYGDAPPRTEEDNIREGPFQVFGSNGSYARFSVANTKAPAIIVGRKGSYGKINWTSDPCFSSDTTFFIDQTTTKHNLRWLFYVLQTLRLDEGSDEAAVPGLNRDDAYERTILVPPLPTQRAIAAYLDRETAKIDAMIDAKQRLLALLAEKRRAIIAYAVIRGLDADAPMRESGVAWLGEIPREWQVDRFKYHCSITEGQIDPKDERFSERILIAPNHIASGTGHILYTETANEQGAISGKYMVKSGQIIYSKIRPELNKVCISQGDWLCSADMYPIQTQQSILPNYLFYFLLSDPFVRLMVDESMRVAMPKVNRETLVDCPIPIPSLDEQNSIAIFLDNETSKIDLLAKKAIDVLNLLHERRAALIAAAVMGQIDV